MGEWNWVVVGYLAMVGALAGYAWWLRSRLMAAQRRLGGAD